MCALIASLSIWLINSSRRAARRAEYTLTEIPALAVQHFHWLMDNYSFFFIHLLFNPTVNLRSKGSWHCWLDIVSDTKHKDDGTNEAYLFIGSVNHEIKLMAEPQNVLEKKTKINKWVSWWLWIMLRLRWSPPWHPTFGMIANFFFHYCCPEKYRFLHCWWVAVGILWRTWTFSSFSLV